jgi:hypothetical protein
MLPICGAWVAKQFPIVTRPGCPESSINKWVLIFQFEQVIDAYGDGQVQIVFW